MKEKKVRSTKAQLTEFRNSFIWLDIIDELHLLSRQSLIEYDLVGEPHVDDQGFKVVPNTSETLIHLGDIKGRRKAIQYFLNILDVLTQSLELEESELKNKS
jgi:hypothetical protein